MLRGELVNQLQLVINYHLGGTTGGLVSAMRFEKERILEATADSTQEDVWLGSSSNAAAVLLSVDN